MTDPQPPASELSGRSAVLAETECLELLTTTTVGRVAFVSADGLQLIPLNFAVVGGEIYFRTATDSVLDDMTQGENEVVLGVDYHSPQFREGWDVTVKGRATRVADPQVYALVMTTPRLRPWAGGNRGVVIHLERSVVDGRRVHGNHPARQAQARP